MKENQTTKGSIHQSEERKKDKINYKNTKSKDYFLFFPPKSRRLSTKKKKKKKDT